MDIIGYCYILRHTIFNATKLNYQHFQYVYDVSAVFAVILFLQDH